MLETTVVLTNRLGLHARAAAKIVRLMSKYESSLTVIDRTNNRSASAASILELLSLSAGFGTKLLLLADGIDEEDAVHSVTQLFENRFDED